MKTNANKLPQGFYNKISSYVVTMHTTMNGINMLSELLTLKSYSTEHLALSVQKSLILHHLFSHELAPILTSLFLDDGSIISASSK